MPDEIKAPEEGQPQKTEEPKVPETPGETKTEVPEKFKGKSAEEIAQAYAELSKQIGKQGEELGRTKKQNEELAKNLKNWEQLGAVIEADPSRFELVKSWVKPTEEPKKDEPKPSEERRFLNKQIIGKFEDKYKINDLESEKAQELRGKIGTHLQLMLDPFGTGENVDKLLEKVPLERLPMYFENAYRLATAGDAEEQARLKGFAEASQNANGMFGSMPSSSVNPTTVVLNEKQKEAAKKLNIQEKDYIEYLKKQ